jgi:hypothetical protein
MCHCEERSVRRSNPDLNKEIAHPSGTASPKGGSQ